MLEKLSFMTGTIVKKKKNNFIEHNAQLIAYQSDGLPES